MERRTFLKAAVIAGATPAVAFAPAVLIEAQEQKCSRLLSEFLAECRKLPLSGKSRYGDYADLPTIGDDHIRYSTQDGGGQEMLLVLVKRS